MATAPLANKIIDPTGAAVVGVTVRIRLRPGPGWRGDQSEIVPEVDTVSDATGAWTVNLERNADITPAGTWYEVIEEIPPASGGTRVYSVAVGAVGGSVLGSLVTPSASTGLAAYLTQAAADVRYQPLGSFGVAGIATLRPGLAKAEGVLAAGAREDHVHDLANPYKAKMRRAGAGAQSVPTGAWTVVQFDTDVFDPDADTTQLNTAGARWTARIAGYYWFSYAVYFAALPTAGQTLAALWRNGVEADRSPPTGSPQIGAAGSTLEFFAAGDYAQVAAFHQSAAAVNLATAAPLCKLDVALHST